MAVENKEDADSTSNSGLYTDNTALVKKGSSGGIAPVTDSDKGDDGNKNKGSGGREGKGKGSGDTKAGQSSLLQRWSALLQFVKEVIIEFKKVSWPERSQIIKETWSVLFLVAVITVTVLAFDWALSHAIFMPLEQWARLHGGGFGHGYQ